ncbi:MAG: hypothetical protein A2V77_13025 [Anaeromyxobacter sp. RBG_16_69_14]|nr:MAG: hypothetical protein A2V77_13025 [Anaeromyxobacter sp. RBG_16_69_14]
MTKRMAIPAILCLAAAGCGGNSDGGNAAASKSFDYGPAQATEAPEGAADAVSSALTFKSGVSSDTAVSAQSSLYSAAAEALGGDSIPTAAMPPQLSPLVRSARSRALATAAGSSTLPSDCYTATTSSVTFSGCKFTDTSDGSTVSVTLDGSVSMSSDTLTWSYTMTMDFSDASNSVAATYKDSGNFTVTATTAKAHDEAEFTAKVTTGGKTSTFGIAQAADLDVTHGTDCASTITGGSFEAKRVWTQKPSNVSDDLVKDKAVKINWTGCGSATMQLSVS